MFASERLPYPAARPRTPRWVALWLISFIVAFVLLGAFGDFIHIAQFPFDSDQVPGTVTAVEPGNHSAAHVRYEVRGRTYEVVSSFRPLTDRGPTEFVVGQGIPVY